MTKQDFKKLNILVKFNNDFVQDISMKILEYVGMDKNKYYLDDPYLLYFDCETSRMEFIELSANYLGSNTTVF